MVYKQIFYFSITIDKCTISSLMTNIDYDNDIIYIEDDGVHIGFINNLFIVYST